jgi:hypothetical protein
MPYPLQFPTNENTLSLDDGPAMLHMRWGFISLEAANPLTRRVTDLVGFDSGRPEDAPNCKGRRTKPEGRFEDPPVECVAPTRLPLGPMPFWLIAALAALA